MRRQGEQMDSSEHVMREQDFGVDGGAIELEKSSDGVTDQMEMVLKV